MNKINTIILSCTVLAAGLTSCVRNHDAFSHRIIDANPPDNVWSKCTADFDSDGTWDKHIVYEGSDSLGFEGGATGDLDGDGEFSRTARYEAPEVQTQSDWEEHIIENNIECVTHALGGYDFDCDGNIDIFTAEMNMGEDPDEVRIYYNYEVGGIAWRKHVISVSGSHSNQFFDFDGDGDVDIIGGNHGGKIKPAIELWINNADPEGR